MLEGVRVGFREAVKAAEGGSQKVPARLGREQVPVMSSRLAKYIIWVLEKVRMKGRETARGCGAAENREGVVSDSGCPPFTNLQGFLPGARPVLGTS